MSLPAYRPMLAVPWAAPFSDGSWSFEPKWDGIRALLYWDGRFPWIAGRRGDDISARYPELTGCAFESPLVLDGEIVSPGPDGHPSFESLQRRMHLTEQSAVRAAASIPIAFVAFDLLHLGDPIVDLPLLRRRELLEEITLPAPFVVSEAVAGDGEALWEAVRERGLEGVVAKRAASRYRPGARSPDWRKIANVLFTRAVVGGFTRGEKGRSGSFGALLLGLADGKGLRFIGAVGTGFPDGSMREIRAALDRIAIPDPPFHPDAGLPPDSVWVEPTLIASVGYRNWTSAGRLRHPRFRGFTADPAESVTWDAEGPGRSGPDN